MSGLFLVIKELAYLSQYILGRFLDASNRSTFNHESPAWAPGTLR